MKKAYIVLEKGYEYNDEVYHEPNTSEEIGTPKRIFLDKKKAKERRDELEIKFLRGLSLGQYGYSIEDITTNRGKFNKIFKSEFDVDLSDDGELYEVEIPESATDEQIKKIMKILKLEFFIIMESEIEE